MAKYRSALPQLDGEFFMTDGGLETTLVFLEGHDLPEFAAFVLHETPEGEEALRKYFQTYAQLAERFETGLVLETATWRANPDWGQQLGYSKDRLAEAFPDLRLTVEDVVSDGEKVAARVTFRGTHRGEFQGIPPTGKKVAFSSMEFNRVVGGKVEEHWVELDLLGLMQQLGAVPPPEEQRAQA